MPKLSSDRSFKSQNNAAWNRFAGLFRHGDRDIRRFASDFNNMASVTGGTGGTARQRGNVSDVFFVTRLGQVGRRSAPTLSITTSL
jgi:hypothetical protein